MKFGNETITCGYCKRTLPSKYCKRHQKYTTIRKVRYDLASGRDMNALTVGYKNKVYTFTGSTADAIIALTEDNQAKAIELLINKLIEQDAFDKDYQLKTLLAAIREIK